MPGRHRTAKFLGTRHDLTYFKQRNWLRKWQLWLGLALPLVVIGWLGGEAIYGHQLEYSAGPLTPAHAVFGRNCSTCHASENHGVRFASFRRHVPDAACLRCHEAPGHHPEQVASPTCYACHLEHSGAPSLRKVPDVRCTSCHGNLPNSSTEFVRHIHSFNVDHPEFAVLRQPESDPGTIAFNHRLHLNGPILGPSGKRVTLECADCHRSLADANRGWPYSESSTESAATNRGHMELDPKTGRALMLPITYAQSCAACHTLEFDRKVSGAVPHENPRVVDAFLQIEFKEYLTRNPTAWREPEPELRRTIGFSDREPAQTPIAHSAAEWSKIRVAQAERLLWTKTCRQCHQLDWPQGESSGTLPIVEPANIKPRWFNHAVFSHEAHQSLQCIACHSAALTSTETEDVLLPSIATCKSCHNGDSGTNGRAENRCFECHQYHNWMERGPGLKGRYSINELIGSAAPSDTALVGQQ